MPQLFTNNARALLASGITNSATSLTVEASKADLFPTANTGTGSVPAATNWFKLTLQDSSGNVEIVYVRTRTAGSGVMSNVIRGQEGTTARAFGAGTVVGLRITAADVEGSVAAAANSVQLSGNQTIAGTKTFSNQIVASGGVQGNVTGNAGTVTNGVYTTGDQTIGGSKTFSSVVTNSNGRYTTSNTGVGMYEMHLPGIASRAWYVAPDGITRLATTNGAGTASTILASVDASGNLTLNSGARVATASLGTGTANNTTFLRGDQTWQTISLTPSTADVLNATAGASVGAVGTYAFLLNTNSPTQTPGGTAAGSTLGYTNAGSATSGGTPAGTWRRMGGNDLAQGGATLYLRIS